MGSKGAPDLHSFQLPICAYRADLRRNQACLYSGTNCRCSATRRSPVYKIGICAVP